MEYAVLISGGVDSSVAVWAMKERGITPALFYIRIGGEGDEMLSCSAEEDIELSQSIARKYGCSLEVVDLHREYWELVVGYLMDRVRIGLTPNPDVMCNKLIKFGAFDRCWGNSFDRIVTGHYASMIEERGFRYLGTACDRVKDQTDFLAQLSVEQLARLEFPLGVYAKKEVREIARREGLLTASRRDSQGICFLGKISYNDLVRRYLGVRTGDIVEWSTLRKLGTHQGYWFHTIGQRKGLFLSGGPWYVVGKEVDRNIVYVAHGDDYGLLLGNRFVIRGVNWLLPSSLAEGVVHRVAFKVRHAPEFLHGTLLVCGGVGRMVSDEPISGIAPGQFAVLYDEGERICLGSGEIGLEAEFDPRCK